MRFIHPAACRQGTKPPRNRAAIKGQHTGSLVLLDGTKRATVPVYTNPGGEFIELPIAICYGGGSVRQRESVVLLHWYINGDTSPLDLRLLPDEQAQTFREAFFKNDDPSLLGMPANEIEEFIVQWLRLAINQGTTMPKPPAPPALHAPTPAPAQRECHETSAYGPHFDVRRLDLTALSPVELNTLAIRAYCLVATRYHVAFTEAYNAIDHNATADAQIAAIEAATVRVLGADAWCQP